MNEEISKAEWKTRLYREIQYFWLYTIFLTLFFSAFTLYAHLIDKSLPHDYLNYTYNFFESLILAKILLIGEQFRLGEKFSEKALVIPVIYKTFVFTLFVLFFTILEHFVIGIFHEIPIHVTYEKLLSEGLNQILAKLLIMIFFFVFFFAFLEISRVMGEGKLFSLFFRKKSDL